MCTTQAKTNILDVSSTLAIWSIFIRIAHKWVRSISILMVCFGLFICLSTEREQNRLPRPSLLLLGLDESCWSVIEYYYTIPLNYCHFLHPAVNRALSAVGTSLAQTYRLYVLYSHFIFVLINYKYKYISDTDLGNNMDRPRLRN